MNGSLCDTFQQACLRLHLIQDDQEWIRCFEEAKLFATGGSLRNLLVVALTFGPLAEPVELWDEFCNYICDDLPHKLQQLFPDNELYTIVNEELFHKGLATLDYGLYLINKKLGEQGRSLETYHMPTPMHNWVEALMNTTSVRQYTNRLINEQLDYDVDDERRLYAEKYALFNTEQKYAFDRIIEQVNSTMPNPMTSTL